MIKTSLLRFLLGLLLLVFAAETAHAQRPSEVEVHTQRERLKQLLGTAREVLAAYPHDRAHELLIKAETLAKEADQKILAGHLAPALAQIREAISLVEKAIKLALESPLLRLYNRVQELLQRAETEVLAGGNREAVRLVQEARKNKLLGEQAALRMQPLQTAQYFQAAITLLERALKLVGRNPGGNGDPADLVQRAREYYLELLKQLEERQPQCRENVAVRRLAQQAQKQIQFAEDALRRSDLAAAQRFFNNAVRLLLRALDLCAPDAALLDAGALATELARVREALAAAEEQAAARNDARDRALLDWVRKLLLEAEADLAAQRLQRAQHRLGRARALLERVLRRKTEAPIDYQAQCETALEELAADLEDLQEELSAASNAQAQNLLELSAKAGAEAEKICRRKPHTLQSVAAFRALLRLAHQFLLQAETLLQDEAPAATQNQEALRQRLQQLAAALDEVRSSAGSGQNSLAKVLVDQAADLSARAQAAFQRGQLYLSAELCNLAFDLLREALKLGNAE
jgi:hypothetical protein